MQANRLINMKGSSPAAVLLALFMISLPLLGLIQIEMNDSEDHMDARIGESVSPLSDKDYGAMSTSTNFEQFDEIWRGTNHTDILDQVAWSPNGTRIASASNDGTAKIWDASTGEVLVNFTGHTDIVTSVTWSPNGSYVATGSVDGTIKIWNSTTGTTSKTLTPSLFPFYLDWSPDGYKLAVGLPNINDVIEVWNISTENLENTLSTTTATALSVDWSPDGSMIASGHATIPGDIYIWDYPPSGPPSGLNGHLDQVFSVRWAPNGTFLASGSKDTTIRIWNVTSLSLFKSIIQHTETVNSVSWSPGGNELVSGSDDQTIKLFNATDGSALKIISGNTNNVTTVDWSPNGKRIASGSIDNTTRVWGDQTPPRAITVEPPDTAFDVPVDTNLNITFNESMNKTSVENAISISPPVGIQSFSWTDNKTTVYFSSNLAGNTPYTVTINSSIAKDYSENYLDGNENGVSEFSPADDYVWSFTTVDVNSPPDPPVDLGVQGFMVAPDILNITDHNPSLNWTFVDPDIEPQSGYNVTVWDSSKTTLYWFNNVTSSFESDIYNSTGTATANLTDGQDYWFGVQTNDSSDAWSPWSEVMFHMNTQPSDPTLVSPPDDSQQPAGGQTLTWNPVIDPEGSSITYYWYVSLDPGFSMTEASASTLGTSDTFTTLLGKNYHWRVQAFDGYEYGLNSTIWNFSTPAGNNPPDMPASLGVQLFTSLPDILNITDHTPDLNWTFSDPDVGDTQGAYNMTAWTGPSGTGTLLFWDNQTSGASSIVYSGTPLADGNDCHLRVMTMDNNGLWSPWSEKKFHMNTPPPVPTLLSPADNSQQVAGLQTLGWTSVIDAEGSTPTYYWYVSTDPMFSSLDADGLNTMTSDSFMSFPGNVYYWRVRAFDGYEFGANGTTWNFTANPGNNPPNAPLNLRIKGFTSSPQIMNITDHTPDLSWTFSDPDVGDAQSAYNVTVWTGPGGTGTLMWWQLQISNAQTTVYSGTPLVDGTSYYLRVATRDFTGLWSQWSEKKFRLNTPPPTPILLNPPDGTMDLNEGMHDLNWTAVIDAEGSPITYHWYVAEDRNFAVFVASAFGGSNSIGFTTQLSRTYYWRVQAHDGYEFGANSTTFMFRTVYNSSMSGKVTDTNGNPVQGATVAIQGTSLSVITNANGEYSIPDITPNAYFVTASKPGYASSTKDVVVIVGKNTVANFTLVITRGSIKGTVLDENGRPMADATVKLLDRQGKEVGTVKTNSTGWYLFENLVFGNYTVKVTMEGYDDYSKDISVLSTTPVQLDPIKPKKSAEPLPLWIIAAIAAIIVIILLLLFMFMKRSGEGAETEPEEPVERPSDGETELSGRYGLEEEQLRRETSESDSEEPLTEETESEEQSNEETDIADSEEENYEGKSEEDALEGDEDLERETD